MGSKLLKHCKVGLKESKLVGYICSRISHYGPKLGFESNQFDKIWYFSALNMACEALTTISGRSCCLHFSIYLRHFDLVVSNQIHHIQPFLSTFIFFFFFAMLLRDIKSFIADGKFYYLNGPIVLAHKFSTSPFKCLIVYVCYDTISI